MRIYLIRFIIILWILALLVSFSALLGWLLGGEIIAALGACISLFTISAFMITLFTFLTLGIIDPRKVLKMLKPET